MKILKAVAAGALGVLIYTLFLGLFLAWPIMVLWGAVADDFGFRTIGLGTALQIGLLSSLLFKSSASSSHER